MCLSLGEEDTSRAAADTARTSSASCFSVLKGCKGIISLKHFTSQISFLTNKDDHFGVETSPYQQKLVFPQQLKHGSFSDTKIVSETRKSLRMASLSFSFRQGVGLIRT